MSKKFEGVFEAAWRAFLALPTEEQAARVAAFRAELAEFRAKRLAEVPFQRNDQPEAEEEQMDPNQVVFWALTDFWAVLSVEDTAQAFEKSLLADFEGSHALYISERQNSAGVDSETLLRIFFPEVTLRRRPIPGLSSIVSYERARELIGFEPQYSLLERLMG